MLMDISHAAAEELSLDLHISIFATCLCDTPALLAILNSTVTTTRPDVYRLLTRILSTALVEDDVEDEERATISCPKFFRLMNRLLLPWRCLPMRLTKGR